MTFRQSRCGRLLWISSPRSAVHVGGLIARAAAAVRIDRPSVSIPSPWLPAICISDAAMPLNSWSHFFGFSSYYNAAGVEVKVVMKVIEVAAQSLKYPIIYTQTTFSYGGTVYFSLHKILTNIFALRWWFRIFTKISQYSVITWLRRDGIFIF